MRETSTNPAGHGEVLPCPDNPAQVDGTSSGRTDMLDHITMQGLAVVLASVGIGLLAPNGAEATPKKPSASQETQSPAAKITHHKPAMSVMRPVKRTKCSKERNVKLSLRGTPIINEGGKTKYQVIAKRCGPKSADASSYKDIHLKVSGPPAKGEYKKQRAVWRFDHLAADNGNRRRFSLESAQIPFGAKTNNVITTSAYNKKGRQVGMAVFRLKPSNRPIEPSPETCKPNPNFQTGIQDDNPIVWGVSAGKAVDSRAVLREAREKYDTTAFRFNILYDDYLKHPDLEPYMNAIEAAEAEGYEETLVTLVPTPSYRTSGVNTLNYKNQSPALMYDMAYDVTKKLSKYKSFKIISPGNEPNHPLFAQPISLESYLPMLEAARDGVLRANHETGRSIKILGGELAPSDPSSITNWIRAINRVDHVSASIHPYNEQMNYIRQYAKEATSPDGRIKLSATEYGNRPGPNQESDNRMAIRVAKCAGLARFILYNVLNDPGHVWQTGWMKAEDLPGTSTAGNPASSENPNNTASNLEPAYGH